jgi:hypothetical protein
MEKIDSNDLIYYFGLLLLGLGLAFGVSWTTALIVIGAILAAVSLLNSYVLTIFASRMNRKD